MLTAGRRRSILALAALAAVTCGTTGQPPPTRLFPVNEQTLPSGLRVVVEHDEGSSIAGVVLTVDAGSVDDPPGKHGTAHTLEHLAFRARGEGGISMRTQLIRLGAASFNGETGIERTTYWAVGPRNTLDRLLAIVLGRLADPLAGMTDKLFAKESLVVAEEMRRHEGAAGAEVMMPALLPPGHPHARAWAERRDAPALSLAEIRSFADTFYRPERMTLVISGPVPGELDKYLAARLPPAWLGNAAQPHPPTRRAASAFDGPRPAPPEIPTEKSASVVVPELWVGWRVPPATGLAASRLEVIARVVDRMLSFRLAPDGTNDVLDIGCWAPTGRMASAILCHFNLRTPGDAVRIRNETRAALEALSDVTLIHIKPRLRASYAWAVTHAILQTALELDSVPTRARTQAALAHFDEGVRAFDVIDALTKLTVDEVAEFAGRYLKPDAARAVLLVPEEIRNITHTRSQLKTAARAADDSAAAGPDVDPDPEPDTDSEAKPDAAPTEAPPAPAPDLQGIVQAPGARAAVSRRLSNGLTLIAMRRPALPFVSMLLGFHADPQPGDAPGARVAFDHALDWDLSDGPLERGILRASRLNGDNAEESLATFSGNLERALDLLVEEGDTMHVSWPRPSFTRWIDRTAMRASSPDDQAARAFRAALFGDHAYRLNPTAEEARAVTERQAQALFERIRRPANGALVIVGDISPDAAAAAAERMLRGWKGNPSPPPPPPLPPSAARTAAASGGTQILHTIDPRRKSAYIRFGCFVPAVHAPRDALVHDLLAGLIESNLLRRLRQEKGVTYAYDVDADFYRGGTAVLLGHVDVDGKATPHAIDVLREWLDDARPAPISSKRLEQHLWNRARRSGLRNATGQQLAQSLFEAWNMGWEPAVLDDYPRDLASVNVKDIEAALAVCRQSAVISVLGPP